MSLSTCKLQIPITTSSPPQKKSLSSNILKAGSQRRAAAGLLLSPTLQSRLSPEHSWGRRIHSATCDLSHKTECTWNIVRKMSRSFFKPLIYLKHELFQARHNSARRCNCHCSYYTRSEFTKPGNSCFRLQSDLSGFGGVGGQLHSHPVIHAATTSSKAAISPIQSNSHSSH